MQITTQDVELRVDDSLMRLYVAKPKAEGSYPGILLYSEIFQLTGPRDRHDDRHHERRVGRHDDDVAEQVELVRHTRHIGRYAEQLSN